MSTTNDPLWDPDAPADPELAALEQRLRAHRWQPRPWVGPAEVSDAGGAVEPLGDARVAHATPAGGDPETRARRAASGHALDRALPRARLLVWPALATLAAGLVLAFGAGRWWRGGTPASDAAYALETLSGAPRVEGSGGSASGALGAAPLAPGQRVVCDDASRARLVVGSIGALELEPGTALRVLAPDALEAGARFALALERGGIAARITSAPRVFQLGTPAGIAVDMGCSYRAHVADDGRTRLAVDGGLVAFAGAARRIVVPAGASAWADPARGPSTPLWDDAAPELRAAVEAFDAGAADGASGSDPALFVALVARAPRDPTLVLWNLLDHPRAAVRAPAYEALASLVPPPAGTLRERVLAGDRDALDRWRAALDWSW